MIEKFEKRFDELNNMLLDPAVLSDQTKLKNISRERRQIEAVVKEGRIYRKCLSDIAGANEIIEQSEDPEMTEMARDELTSAGDLLQKTEEKLNQLLSPRDPNDVKNAIIEIRAGTGGNEAAIFAADLYRMYSKYAEDKGWKTETLSSNYIELGGIKEVIFMVKGDGAYGNLKFESGVHRVQRVPVTESQGRIHTSAATVAVLLEAEEIDIKIEENDIKVDVYRSSGPGGQSVNTTDSAVRITHLPTGLVVTCQDEKSQHKNKARALQVLRARLYDKMIEEQNREIAEERKSMVGSGDRSAKIRTYNFPQSRVTDHRIGLTLHRLDDILDGNLDELISALQKNDQEERLAQKKV
ncbi:MAG: peptide chain release factor 1 [candidate division Zixibacteria bacterium HGW-Zixibacteria-1]|nr:MAG: peptide chain release factor 1 [candidate division Zixibacteria bacterium HGW-Zixibacteria-1]